MSSCEKCWADAYRMEMAGEGSRPDLYERLIRDPNRNCTPEEQAGPDAKICLVCKRKVLHQITGQCMNPKCEADKARQDRHEI